MEGRIADGSQVHGAARMVRDDRGDIHVEIADALAIEQVGKAMVHLRDEDGDASALHFWPYPPVHFAADRERLEACVECGQGFGLESQLHAHEEETRFKVVELLRFKDVAVRLEDQARNVGD